MRLLVLSLLVGGCLPDPGPGHDLTPHADLVAEQSLSLPSRMTPPPPLRPPGDAPDVTVYGYWPYWGDPLSTLQWDQLTHVALFDVGLLADGSLSNTSRWTANAPTALSLAAPYGVRVHLTVTCFDDAVMASVLGSPSRRTAAVANLAALVSASGGHGVNVDFEGMDATWRAAFTAFIAELSAAVDDVYIALPPIDWSDAYDEGGLAAVSEGLFIMGYNYHWSGGGPGPVAPLRGGGVWATWSLARSVDDFRAAGAPDDKIILGMPLYGYDWPTTSTAVPGTRTGNATASFYASAATTAATYGRQYDAGTETPYTFPSATRQLWYDDAVSIEAKVAFGVDQGLQGVGFWALTYDDADPDLWQRIDAHTHAAVPVDTAPEPCADTDGDGVPDCTVCGDGVVEAPETCDDGGIVDGDGCSAICQVEALGPLAFDGVTPGRAGAVNTFTITGGTPGERVVMVTSRNLGSTQVPGCPGQAVPLQAPLVVGNVTVDAVGVATRSLRVPAAVRGDTYAFFAVEQATCRVSDALVVVF